MKSLAEQFQNRCVHFTGIQNARCEADVSYVELVPEAFGRALKLPCLADKVTDVVCPKRQFPTDAETAAYVERQRQSDAEFSRALLAVAPFRKTHRGRDFEVKCPVCADGTIYGTIAQLNGHCHAACSTPTCVRWME